MIQINFKNFDQNFFKEEYEDLLGFRDEMLHLAKNNGDRLYYLYIDAKSWVTLKYIEGSHGKASIAKDLLMAMQGIYGHIKTLSNFGKPTKIPIDGEEVELVNKKNSYDTVFDLWGAYVNASICRNKDVIDLVMAQDDSTLFFREGRFEYSSAYKILKFFKNEKEVDEESFEHCQKANLDRLQGAEEEGYREYVSKPLIALEHAYFFSDANTFNQSLETALNKNREYYDTEEEGRCRDSINWLPWPIIFVACKAYDKGWKITVDDPRLPMAFVTGEYNVPSVYDK